MNIWLVNSIVSTTQGANVAGFSTLASSHGSFRDGIVNEANLFGSSVDNSKVHIHEAGHYLNLYHTFEGGCNNDNCQVDGDRVCDTPPDATTQAVSCSDSPNTCSTDSDDSSLNNPFRAISEGGLGDQPDMFNNYMDYGFQACQNAFTEGQRERMVLSLQLIRSSLLESDGCQDPCLNPITLDATITNTSIGLSTTYSVLPEAGVSYNWDFGDGTLITMGSSVIHTYSEVGEYTVILTADNGDANCTEIFTQLVRVSCTAEASFSDPGQVVALNSPVSFNNTSTGGTSYSWLLDGQEISTDEDLVYTFANEGAFSIQLVASNDLCSDTSSSILVRSGACAQSGVGDKWYFGRNAAVDFSSGNPVSMSGSAMSAGEGVASIADANGNLLFYTNGNSVWNSNNVVMPNGSGLLGQSISAQSSIIIPLPGNDDLYYIFTIRDWQNTSDENLRYSIVDMSLNGGLGDVVATQKNVTVHNNVAERVTGVFHANCIDVWIVSHEKNNADFVAYLLTEDGLSTAPVISTVGSVTNGTNRYGGLRASHNGRKLCSTLGGTFGASPSVELFDFDNETGVVSNGVPLLLGSESSAAYSSEFSPNDRLLYVVGFNTSYIYQYDLNAGTDQGIIDSRLDISDGTRSNVLQSGPDGKIYVSQSGESALGVIDNPNVRGVGANHNGGAISLSGTGSLGLPNFLPGFFGDAISIDGPSSTCANGTVTYEAVSSGCVDSIEWIYNGEGSIVEVDGSFITIDFTGAEGIQELQVTAVDQCGEIKSFLFIDINNDDAPDVSIGGDTVLCANSLVLDAGSGFVQYEWQDGSMAQTIDVSDLGIYTVTVYNESGCSASASREVIEFVPASELDLGADTTLCFGGVLSLNAGEYFDSFLWSTNSGESSITIAQREPEAITSTYTVTVVDECGSSASDEIVVTYENCDSMVVDSCMLTVSDDVTICEGESTTLSATLTDCDIPESNCDQGDVSEIDCSVCSASISGSGNETINNGETVCVLEGTEFTGNLNLNGGLLVVCGTLVPSNMNYNDGGIVILGSASFANINMNNQSSFIRNYGDVTFDNVTFNGVVENHATAFITRGFNINSPATFINKGTFIVEGALHNNGLTENEGTLLVDGDLKNNGSATFDNYCTIEVEAEFHNNSNFSNSGNITVFDRTYLNGGSVLYSNAGSSIVTESIAFNGTIEAAATDCSLLQVNGESILNSSATINGALDYCDVDGVESPYDVNFTFPSNVTTDCSCSANSSGSISLASVVSWNPSTGLSSSTVLSPVATPDITTTYEVEFTKIDGSVINEFVTVYVENCDVTDSLDTNPTDSIDNSNESYVLTPNLIIRGDVVNITYNSGDSPVERRVRLINLATGMREYGFNDYLAPTNGSTVTETRSIWAQTGMYAVEFYNPFNGEVIETLMLTVIQ